MLHSLLKAITDIKRKWPWLDRDLLSSTWIFIPSVQTATPGSIAVFTVYLHATMPTLSTSRGPSVLAVSTVFTSLATAMVLIRIYTRAVLVKQMGSDDYSILIALVRGRAGSLLYVCLYSTD